MAESVARESGREATGSQTQDAGNATLARGAAGMERGAKPQVEDDSRGDIEDRRETEQVLRSTSDGMGEGLATDRS